MSEDSPYRHSRRSAARFVRDLRSQLLVIATVLLAVFGVAAQGGEQTAAPPVSPYDLNDGLDGPLQGALQRSLSKLDLARAIAAKHLAVSLVDVTDPATPRLAMMNGHDMMYAASLPKIAILLAAFQKASEGHLELDEETRHQLTIMIRFSSDTAATYMLNRVGREYLLDVLRSPRYRFYDPNLNGGLWVGKSYASSGAYQRDPLHNLSHGATAFQVARFYYLLETSQLVSPEYSGQMKEMMSSPGIHHKFVAGLERTHPDAQIFRKSGTWRDFHADSAIIERAGRRYIAVAIAEDPAGGEWLRKLIVAMDEIIFTQPDTVRLAHMNE